MASIVPRVEQLEMLEIDILLDPTRSTSAGFAARSIPVARFTGRTNGTRVRRIARRDPGRRPAPAPALDLLHIPSD